MTASAAMISQVRGWVNEPDDTTYDNDAVTVFIERYPLIDERGEVPYTFDTSTEPPTQDDNDNWMDTYDLHAAAADIWAEKAAPTAQDYDFKADGGSYSRSQSFEQCMAMSRYHGARRKPNTVKLHKYPEEESGAATLLREFGS